MSLYDAYPATVHEVLDDQMKFNPAALRAVAAFARTGVWRGTSQERQEKFESLHRDLCAAYSITPLPRLIFTGDDAQCSSQSCYIPSRSTIVLRGRLSVVTYLHEFGHARGMNEYDATRFSINLFRRCFPRSWARARFEGHMIRAGGATP